MKPAFLVIGAAKAGTTTLCRLLGEHPDVFLSTPKELHYFSFDGIYALGSDWYESWFAGAAPHQIAGEGSPTYTASTVWPNAAQRISRYAPGAKLIYVVRHPLDRIESLWMQIRSWGTEYPWRHAGTFRVDEPLWVEATLDESVRRRRALVDSTNYLAELEVYRDHFPDEQILVLFFEDLATDPGPVLVRCFEFLGIDPTVEIGGLGLHLNAWSEQEVHRDLVWRLWSVPCGRDVYRAIVDRVPASLRRLLGPHLRRSTRGRPSLSGDARTWVWEQLRGDIGTFLERYGKPPDYWSLGT